MFKLTDDEKQRVVANCDHLKNLKFSRTNPHAFTEHGVIMAASVLNSQRAIEISVLVVRTFVKLREMLSSHKELKHKLKELENKILSHDKTLHSLVIAIKRLMDPPASPSKRTIGFHPGKMKQMANKTSPHITPLFLPRLENCRGNSLSSSESIGKHKHIIQFAVDDYKKAIDESLIDVKTDTDTISAFLSEFYESPLTLQAYAKEIERLLLWCIHIARMKLSSLRRNHLVEYQSFLKNPEHFLITALRMRTINSKSFVHATLYY